jgi:hypothetical protein
MVCSTTDKSLASAGAIAASAAGPTTAAPSAAVPQVIRPLRANDVHDSKVRRIDAITPDMVCPKPHDFAPGTRLNAKPVPISCRSRSGSRIERQYPQRESAGKSPDRERKTAPRKNAVLNFIRTIFMKMNPNQRPVEPKPPLPRSVAESATAATSSARITGAITICAIRSPRRIGNGASP